MKEHRHTAACSFRVDEHALRRMGYEVPVYDGDDPFAGVTQKVKQQAEVSRVRYQAMVDGKVRCCTYNPEYASRTGDEPAWSKKLKART